LTDPNSKKVVIQLILEDKDQKKYRNKNIRVFN